MFTQFTQLMAPEDPPAGGGAGDPPAGDPPPSGTILDNPPAGDPPAGDGTWSWGEDIPGTGTAPPWFNRDKYKTVTEQAKATPELETKLGPAAEMLGAPEGNYEMPKIPEGVAGEWDPEDGMLKTFMGAAKEAGLSQAGFDKLVAPMATLLAQENAAEEKAVSDALAELGTNVTARIQDVKKFMISALGTDGYTEINNAIGTSVGAYRHLEKLVGLAAGDAQLSTHFGKTGASFTKEDIIAAQYKVFPEGHNLAGQHMYEHDKEYRATVDKMWKELFPGADEQQVG